MNRKCQRQWKTQNYYPNCYCHSISHLSPPRSEIWRIINTISSIKETQGGATIKRTEEGNESPIQIGQDNMRKTSATMSNPKLLTKLLWPLPQSMLDPNKRKLAHQNRHLLNKGNRKDVLRLKEEKAKTSFPFKQVQKIRKEKRQQQWRTPNYYPNYYGHPRSQVSTPSREIFHIRTSISSRK